MLRCCGGGELMAALQRIVLTFKPDGLEVLDVERGVAA